MISVSVVSALFPSPKWENVDWKSDPTPPSWPDQFVMNWTLYYAPQITNQPPYSNNGIPNPPYCAGRGSTFYDWSTSSMLEVYDDFCVPIFPNGSNWRCHFLNTQNIAYLITFEDRPPNQPPCWYF